MLVAVMRERDKHHNNAHVWSSYYRHPPQYQLWLRPRLKAVVLRTMKRFSRILFYSHVEIPALGSGSGAVGLLSAL